MTCKLTLMYSRPVGFHLPVMLPLNSQKWYFQNGVLQLQIIMTIIIIIALLSPGPLFELKSWFGKKNTGTLPACGMHWPVQFFSTSSLQLNMF